MITLTSSHSPEDPLSALLDGMKKAKTALRQHRVWKTKIRPNLIGSVTATEVSSGSSGWHVHFHEILIFENEESALNVRFLESAWLASLRGVGLSGEPGISIKITDASKAGRYIAKFGDEATIISAFGHEKSKRRTSLTPWDLLALATASQLSQAQKAFFAARWREYVEAFTGVRQIIWSPGLKGTCGLLQAEENPEEADDAEVLIEISVEVWRQVRHLRDHLIQMAEEGASREALLDWIVDPPPF